jgi:predicted PurR-regulated permease PerM
MAHLTNIEHRQKPGEDTPETPPRGPAVAHGRRNGSHWALDVLGAAAILAVCYIAEEPLVVILVAGLIAFILDPVAELFTRIRLPRPAAAAFSVLLLLGVIAGVAYVGVNRATDLLEELPKYSREIRRDVSALTSKVQKLDALNPAEEKGAVKVRETPNWGQLLTRGFGSASPAVLAASFVPFLVFFMLTWKEHARQATMGLFARENKRAAYLTMGLISSMIRNFMVGNLIIGLIMGAVSTIVFAVLHIPFFYFAGFLSGFFSLVPYLGVILALLPPVFMGVGHLTLAKVMVIALTVFTLHLAAINVLYPKFLGGRLRLNPLTVTLALLVWGWLWGAAGLILAVPITGALKIIFDHVAPLKPFGAWLGGERPPNGDSP